MSYKIRILISLLLVFCFCSKENKEVAVDLVKEFPQASIASAYRTVNLLRSWNENDRAYGWNKNREKEKNAVLVPVHKDKAVFRFGCLRKKSERIAIQLRSMLGEGKNESPALDIFLNGTRVFSSPFDWTEYRRISFLAKKEDFRIGENYLEFRRSPLPSGMTSNHWLAVRKIVLGQQSKPADVVEAGKRAVEVISKKRLFARKTGIALPLNSAVSYVLKMTKPAKLAFDLGWDMPSPSSHESCRFFVYLETPDRGCHVLYGQELNKDHRLKGVSPLIDLSPFEDEIVRISFVFLNDALNENQEPRLAVWEPRIYHETEELSAAEPDAPNLQKPFNILIYLVDCLRPDRMSFFGYEKNIAPRMAEFAGDCLLFKNAYAQSSWTRPSVAALFTGLYPFQHQAVTLKSGLAAEFQTMAERLKDQDFYTIGISSNAGIKRFFNFHQGFVFFKYHSNLDGGQAEALNAYAFDQLQLNRKPFFLYIHTMEPHRPYKLKDAFYPPPVKESRKVSVGNSESPRYTVDLSKVLSHYDASITQNDKAFGDLMDELKRLKLYDSTLVILMSDHGEEFYEHGGFAHGNKLYQESVRHLFIVKLPEQKNAGTIIEENVQEIDIFPTILDLTGLPVPSYCAGKSLKPMLLVPDSLESPFHREIFVETGDELRKKAIIDGRWKLIHTGNDWTEDLREYELFNLRDDPGERLNLIGHNSVAAAYMKSRLKNWAKIQKKLTVLGKEDIEKILTQKEIDELKALGYIE